MQCKNCEKELKDGTSFCPYCGKKIENEPEPIKFCPICNCDIEPDMLFCPSCGYSLSDDAQTDFEHQKNEDLTFEEDKIYCVVITGTTNGTAPLINLISKKTGLNIKMSTTLANSLPFPLFLDLSKEEANATVTELEKEGIVAVVKDSANLPQSTNNSSYNTQSSNNTTSTDENKRKAKLKTATVLSTIGAMLSTVVALCILLLPLFTNTYSETIAGATTIKEKNVSLLTFVIESIKYVVSLSDSSSSYASLNWIWLVVRIAITIAVVSLLVSSIKLSIENFKNLIGFEKYSNLELSKDATARSAEEFVKSFKGAKKGNLLFQVFLDLGLIVFIFGYGTIIWETIFAIAVIAFVSSIITKIAISIKKNALA